MGNDMNKVMTDDEARGLNNANLANQLFKIGNLIQNLQKYCEYLEGLIGGGGGSGVDQTARDMAQSAQNAVSTEITNRQNGDAALETNKQNILSDEQLAVVNGDPFVAANYSTTVQMTAAINAALGAFITNGADRVPELRYTGDPVPDPSILGQEADGVVTGNAHINLA